VIASAREHCARFIHTSLAPGFLFTPDLASQLQERPVDALIGERLVT